MGITGAVAFACTLLLREPGVSRKPSQVSPEGSSGAIDLAAVLDLILAWETRHQKRSFA